MIHKGVETQVGVGNYLFSQGYIKSFPKTSLLLLVGVDIIVGSPKLTFLPPTFKQNKTNMNAKT